MAVEFRLRVCDNKKRPRRHAGLSSEDSKIVVSVPTPLYQNRLRRRNNGIGRPKPTGAILAFVLLGWPQVLYAHVQHAAGATTGWDWRHWEVAVTVAISATIYLRGWLFLRQSTSRNASLWRLGSYGIGLASLIVALISPVDTLASERLSMHMVQHILLLMIAPLAILLADPFGPFLWGLPLPFRIRFARLFHRRTRFRSVATFLTFMPVAWGIYVLNLWSWHHPALYEAALVRPWLHDLEHCLFFLTALLFWWPITNVPPMLHGQISLAFRIVYLVAATLQNTLLGMAISLPGRILYPFYDVAPALQSLSPIQDQALGGGIMWVSGHMYLIPIIVLIANKLAAADEATNRSCAIPLSAAGGH